MNIFYLNVFLKDSSLGSTHVNFHLIFYNYCNKAEQFPHISHRMKQRDSSAASILLQTAWQLYKLKVSGVQFIFRTTSVFLIGILFLTV